MRDNMFYVMLAVVAAFMFSLTMPAPSAAWAWLPYKQAYNITVANWSYSQAGLSGVSPKANFVLITLTNVTYASTIATRGYGPALNNQGYIPFWVVSQSGNTVVLLLSNLTNESQRWSLATVYYNPATALLGVSCPPRYPTTTTSTSTSAPTPYLTGSFQYGRQCSGASLQYPVAGAGEGYPQTFSVFGPMATTGINFTSVFTVSNTASLQFTLNTCGLGLIIPKCNPLGNYSALNTDSVTGSGFTYAFAVLANSTLVSRSFNESWRPNSGSDFVIRANGTRYNLVTKGCAFAGSLFCSSSPFVSNSPISSINANEVFMGKTDGIGYEGWFGVNANQVASEGMSTIDGDTFISNSVSTQGVRSVLFAPSYQFNLTVNTNAPTTYYILPAFTTNIIGASVSNQVFNGNPVPSTCTAYFYFCFNARYNVTNIKWQYNYSTNATGGNSMISKVWFNLTSGKVPYAKITIPYYPTLMGPYCSDIYITDSVYNESIPYYILNCTGQVATIILSNTTSGSQLFNSINVYYDSSLYGNPSSSNVMVDKGWNFANGASLTFTDSGGTYLPFTFNLSVPLSLYSTITDYWSYLSYSVFSNLGGVYELQTTSNYPYPHSSSIIKSVVPLTQYFYDVSAFVPYDIAVSELANKNMLLIGSSTYEGCGISGPDDCTYMGNTTANVMFNNAGDVGSTVQLALSLANGITASAYYLATTTYINGTNSWAPGISNKTTMPRFPVFTSTIPQTSNGINYTATTTLNFNSITGNEVAIGDTGLNVPVVALEAFDILLLLIVFAAMEEDHILASVAIIIMVWVLGIFGGVNGKFQLLAIAVIATLLVIVEHFVLEKHRNKKIGGDSDGR